MKVPSGGGASAANQAGAGNTSKGLDKSGAAAAALETGGNVGGLIVDAIGNQVGHEQSMMGKEASSRTAIINMHSESESQAVASRMSKSEAQVKELRSSLL